MDSCGASRAGHVMGVPGCGRPPAALSVVAGRPWLCSSMIEGKTASTKPVASDGFKAGHATGCFKTSSNSKADCRGGSDALAAVSSEIRWVLRPPGARWNAAAGSVAVLGLVSWWSRASNL